MNVNYNRPIIVISVLAINESEEQNVSFLLLNLLRCDWRMFTSFISFTLLSMMLKHKAHKTQFQWFVCNGNESVQNFMTSNQQCIVTICMDPLYNNTLNNDAWTLIILIMIPDRIMTRAGRKNSFFYLEVAIARKSCEL